MERLAQFAREREDDIRVTGDSRCENCIRNEFEVCIFHRDDPRCTACYTKKKGCWIRNLQSSAPAAASSQGDSASAKEGVSGVKRAHPFVLQSVKRTKRPKTSPSAEPTLASAAAAQPSDGAAHANSGKPAVDTPPAPFAQLESASSASATPYTPAPVHTATANAGAGPAPGADNDMAVDAASPSPEQAAQQLAQLREREEQEYRRGSLGGQLAQLLAKLGGRA